jgi:hypothetical protein
MTGYVEFFESCDDCIGNGLCPGCGNLTIDIAAANRDIDSVTCAICGWHYDLDRFNDDGDYDGDYDDGSSSVDDKLDGYDEPYELDDERERNHDH